MSGPNSFNRRQALRLGGAAMALPIAGCGKKAGQGGDINIVMTAGLSGLTVHQVAVSQGYFAQQNVNPKVLQVSDGSKCVAALLSGAAKLCAWSGFSQVTPAIERGADLRIVAGALSIASQGLYSGREDVRTAKDVEGKVVGIGAPGSVLHQMTVLLLKKKGVNVDKVQFRNVGGSADILKAVIAKTVDAGVADVDIWEKQHSLGIHALPDGLFWDEIPEYTNQATYASERAIRDDRDLLVRTLAAYAKAYRFVSGPESRDAFLKARQVVSSSAEQTQAITQWNWIQKYQPYAKDLVLSDERINVVQRLNVEFGVQKTVLPLDKVADMSLAADALKRLG